MRTPFQLAGRAGMESYEAYDTRHKKRCATIDHVCSRADWACWSIRLQLSPFASSLQLCMKFRAILGFPEPETKIFNNVILRSCCWQWADHGEQPLEGWTCQRIWRCKVNASWLSNPASAWDTSLRDDCGTRYSIAPVQDLELLSLISPHFISWRAFPTFFVFTFCFPSSQQAPSRWSSLKTAGLLCSICSMPWPSPLRMDPCNTLCKCSGIGLAMDLDQY